MFKLTSRRGPDGRNSRAGFGLRAGLCQPLIYPKQMVREAQLDKSTGHVSGDSLLLLPWLGGEKAQEELIVTLGCRISCGPNNFIWD